jgi:hypothetical protein
LNSLDSNGDIRRRLEGLGVFSAEGAEVLTEFPSSIDIGVGTEETVFDCSLSFLDNFALRFSSFSFFCLSASGSSSSSSSQRERLPAIL